jgi:[ribosomal protein S18]-alanine N-acetyltransferase
MPGVLIRAATECDLPVIAHIQAQAPEASQWPPEEYVAYDCRVAVSPDGNVAGFLVSRTVAGETEVLNLAVHPDYRRRGIGRLLLRPLLESGSGALYLEVRESNHAARAFYWRMGFSEVGTRPRYYHSDGETAVVLSFRAC